MKCNYLEINIIFILSMYIATLYRNKNSFKPHETVSSRQVMPISSLLYVSTDLHTLETLQMQRLLSF